MSNFAQSCTQTSNVVEFQLDAQNPAEHKIFIRPSAPVVGLEIVSFIPSGGMEEGCNLCIVNDSANDIVLKHNDSAGNVGRRLIMTGGADVTLAPGRPLWGTLVENSVEHLNGWRFESL
jgi:hypothetical protein